MERAGESQRNWAAQQQQLEMQRAQMEALEAYRRAGLDLQRQQQAASERAAAELAAYRTGTLGLQQQQFGAGQAELTRQQAGREAFARTLESQYTMPGQQFVMPGYPTPAGPVLPSLANLPEVSREGQILANMVRTQTPGFANVLQQQTAEVETGESAKRVSGALRKYHELSKKVEPLEAYFRAMEGLNSTSEMVQFRGGLDETRQLGSTGITFGQLNSEVENIVDSIYTDPQFGTDPETGETLTTMIPHQVGRRKALARDYLMKNYREKVMPIIQAKLKLRNAEFAANETARLNASDQTAPPPVENPYNPSPPPFGTPGPVMPAILDPNAPNPYLNQTNMAPVKLPSGASYTVIP
jgi:hypothetical protein